MITFIQNLKHELDQKLQPVLSDNSHIMKKSRNAALVYAEVFRASLT